jgi:16S rRNA (guanine527-N7)-methyltransferase
VEGIDIVKAHFPDLSSDKYERLEALVAVFLDTNDQINLISRKDAEHIWTRHILHSLSVAKMVQFQKGMKVADVGTGGGLPGLPLAILFPETEFTLIDSIGKKIKAVTHMLDQMDLKNVTVLNKRIEEVKGSFDFVVSRAVKPLPVMNEWLKGKIKKGKKSELPNGLIYIKGGDYQQELDQIGCNYRYWYLDDWFEDPFFETKKIVWLDIAR